MVRRSCALIVCTVLVGLIAGCGGREPPADTGVEGRVTVGPICPVVQVGQDCPDQPYAAELAVADPGGKIVARSMADAEGRFRIALPPGEYVLEAKAANGAPLPAAAASPFLVRQGEWTRLDVTMDSGIR